MENTNKSHGYRITIEKFASSLPQPENKTYVNNNTDIKNPAKMNETESGQFHNSPSPLTTLAICLPIVGGFFAYLSYYHRLYAAWPGWLPNWVIELLTTPPWSGGGVSPEPGPSFFATDTISSSIMQLDVLYSSLSIFLNSLPGIC